MGQSSYIYILWIVILAAGLWFIIGFGSTLRAQEDLAGEWELTPEQPIVHDESSRMRVDQSGRYFNLSLPNQPPLRMRLTEQAVVDQRFGEHKRIVLVGDRLTATFEGRSHGDLWRLSLNGSHHDVYAARLVDRTYPKPAPATQPSWARVRHAR